MGQHYVPQMYLNHFEDPGHPGFVWPHDKKSGTARLVKILKTAQAKGFYSESMEKRLAQEVEIPGNNAMEKIRNGGTISPAERLDLAYYVGCMIRRVPYHRRWTRGLLPEVLAATTARFREELQMIAADRGVDPELIAKRLRLYEKAEADFLVATPPKLVEQMDNPIPTEAITSAVYGMTWRVLRSPGLQYFVTTDNPAFFFRAEGYGLGNAPSELSFPLSTSLALHGSRQGPSCGLMFVDATQKTVREINRRLASQTERLAFYHKPAPWLLKFLPNEDPYLSRIVWGKKPLPGPAGPPENETDIFNIVGA